MSSDDWKQKYLNSLDALEKREQAWQATEALLKTGLNRVALAAQGLDKNLDEDLTQLRKTIRGNIDLHQLESVVEDLSHSVTKLDEKRTTHTDAVTPQQLLIRWLDSLKLPQEFSQRLKSLRKSIDDTDGLNQIEVPLRELASLINNALEQEIAAGTGTTDGGFFSRWFGTGNSPSTTDSQTKASTPSSDSAPQIGQFCIQLLDTLSLPSELTDDVEKLKDQLAAGLTKTSIAPALNAIADLISTMRHQMEDENKELQDFLRQLTENLKDLDQNLAGAQSQHSAGVSSGRDFGDQVQQHVKEIESTVDEAPESSQLKQQIKARLNAIRNHLDQYRNAEESRQKQLEARLTLLNHRIHNMEDEGEKLREKLSEKHQQAVHDPLTGLYNRLAYDERVAQEFARWKRYGHAMVLMMVDIDKFKLVNDKYGHKAGDKALILIANQLKDNLREIDFLARYGGEEFVILISETELNQAILVAEKLRVAVEKCEFHYQGIHVPITISAGLAQLRENDTIEKIFQRADKAMYCAKDAGRNCCLTENDL